MCDRIIGTELMKKVSIVGFGRFGRTLYRLIKGDFQITVYNRSPIDDLDKVFDKNTILATEPGQVYESEVIFYAVPISQFESVIKSHKKYIKSHHLLIDVLSVKIHPQEVYNRYLKGTGVQALLSHPMFGPDSSRDGFSGLPIILDKFKTDDENYGFWKDYFRIKGLKIIEMSPRDHDRIASDSQGMTHFIGRLLESYGFRESIIDSLGTKKLHEVKDQTCNDTWELFYDLQHYNPFTKNMRIKLGQKYDELYNKLLPKIRNKSCITYGIQGGRGSFNEEAINYYLHREAIPKFFIKYLYTSENVLKTLHEGQIDFGQFAIHNSVGGVVEESIIAMARYKFKIINQFAIKISHALMIRKDSDISKIKTVMTHPQVLAQCKNSLFQKYPKLVLRSGEGEKIDQAVVAKKLSENKLPGDLATIGSKNLAAIYGLKVVEDNLQDARENFTGFLVVGRM